MVTITVCPTMRYYPLTMSCEKRPECLSPMKVAPLSLAAFLALVSSEEGFRFVSILKGLATIFLPSSSGRFNDKTACVLGPTPPAARRPLLRDQRQLSVAILLSYGTRPPRCRRRGQEGEAQTRRFVHEALSGHQRSETTHTLLRDSAPCWPKERPR